MKPKNLKPRVFFNASVILSGLHSPLGGSGTLLTMVKQKRITGIISEIILDEILRHVERIGLKKPAGEKIIFALFKPLQPAPQQKTVQRFTKIVIDQGDAHVLASHEEAQADALVTLDKKHLLILQNKINSIRIVSPKELLEELAKK